MGESDVQSLSAQQRKCLRLVGDGFTSLEISGQLGISSTTVNTHIAKAIQKLRARNRMHAARILREHERSQDARKAPEILSPEILRLAPDPVAVSSRPSTEALVRESHVQSDTEFAPVDSSAPRGGTDRERPNHLKTVLMIIAIAVGVAILIIAFPSLLQNSKDLANDIQPYHD